MWTEGKIGSAECLARQFELVDNLDEKLIDEYISTIEPDPYFREFIKNSAIFGGALAFGGSIFSGCANSNSGLKIGRAHV